MKLLVPIETGSKTTGEGMGCEIYRPALSLARKGVQDAATHPDIFLGQLGHITAQFAVDPSAHVPRANVQ
jgi:hypothetical protein